MRSQSSSNSRRSAREARDEKLKPLERLGSGALERERMLVGSSPDRSLAFSLVCVFICDLCHTTICLSRVSKESCQTQGDGECLRLKDNTMTDTVCVSYAGQ